MTNYILLSTSYKGPKTVINSDRESNPQTNIFPGMNKETLEAGFYRYLFRYAEKNDYNVGVTPYMASKVFNKVQQAQSFG